MDDEGGSAPCTPSHTPEGEAAALELLHAVGGAAVVDHGGQRVQPHPQRPLLLVADGVGVAGKARQQQRQLPGRRPRRRLGRRRLQQLPAVKGREAEQGLQGLQGGQAGRQAGRVCVEQSGAAKGCQQGGGGKGSCERHQVRAPIWASWTLVASGTPVSQWCISPSTSRYTLGPGSTPGTGSGRPPASGAPWRGPAAAASVGGFSSSSSCCCCCSAGPAAAAAWRSRWRRRMTRAASRTVGGGSRGARAASPAHSWRCPARHARAWCSRLR